MRNIRRVDSRFYVLLLIIAPLTSLVHEAAHWLTGVALGHTMSFSINGVGAAAGTSVRDHILIAAAGPLVTLLQGIVAFMLVRSRDSVAAYGVLFFALMMRATAMGVSLFHLNDEARISDLLGLGPWTLPSLMVGVLLILTVVASRGLRLGWKTNAAAYLVSTVAITAIVMGDMAVKSWLG